jgi:hypothetical protein
MRDHYITKLLRLLQRKKTREAINALLRGNDAGCFTTDQYKRRYCLGECKDAAERALVEDRVQGYDRVVGDDWGRTHLSHSGNGLREVRTDVWTPEGL